MNNGLRDKYPELFALYEENIAESQNKCVREIEAALKITRRQLKEMRPIVEQQLRHIARKRFCNFRKYVTVRYNYSTRPL